MLALINKALSFLSEELDVATTGHTQETPADRSGGVRTDRGPSTSAVLGSKVFVVHGHDRAARHEVARFIEQLKLEVIILDEQPSQSRTIIEKFEKSADRVRLLRNSRELSGNAKRNL